MCWHVCQKCWQPGCLVRRKRDTYTPEVTWIRVLFERRPRLTNWPTCGLTYRRPQFDNIDLAVLNATSPILRFEAVSGRAALCRDAPGVRHLSR